MEGMPCEWSAVETMGFLEWLAIALFFIFRQGLSDVIIVYNNNTIEATLVSMSFLIAQLFHSYSNLCRACDDIRWEVALNVCRSKAQWTIQGGRLAEMGQDEFVGLVGLLKLLVSLIYLLYLLV